ncbi:MAG TPA: LemA family protein [Gammaproteobacteria bacterium]|nr:LemA family protein [Gammaproteobacteria bacterium]
MEILSFKYLLLIALLVVTLWAIASYNALVALKHGVAKAWSNIDVLLKQRFEELPKLVEVCRQYMRHERETLERVIVARNAVAAASNAGNMRALGEAEGVLRRGLGQLFALAENYPDLKADEGFRNLQTRISQLENTIADRREFYNESVNLLNVRIESFPDTLIARFFGFRSRGLLRFSSAETADVNLKALFNG